LGNEPRMFPLGQKTTFRLLRAKQNSTLVNVGTGHENSNEIILKITHTLINSK